QVLLRTHRAALAGGVAFAVLVSLAASGREVAKLITSQQAVEYETVGEYIGRHSTAGDVVLSSRPHVFFFGNRRGLLFSDLAKEAIHDLRTLVAREQIGWVVFDERTAAQQFPGLVWLLDPTSTQAARLGWHAVHTVDSPMRVVVWRTSVRDGAT